MNKVKAAHKES